MPGGCVIGVDLGGTKLLAGAVDDELEVHHRAVRPAADARGDARGVVDLLVEVVEETRQAVGGEVRGVGLGVPSLIDQRRGVVVSTVHLPLVDLPLRDLMAERLGLPVALDNDANVAMLAERRHGAAAGAEHAILITVGTGIGGGFVVDGRLLRGAVGAAAEPGHMVLEADGLPCRCGSRGCMETLVSGTALARHGLDEARRAPGTALGRALAEGREITGVLVTELAHDGDPAAARCVERIGVALGVGVASLVNLFNPEVVVVGGGVIAAGELLLEPARRVVAERALSPSKDVVRIVPARFGAEAGMLGAALLAMELDD